MGKAIGIDLGTTNTAVAVLVEGRPRVLEDERGYKVLPSCVSMKKDGEFVVGQAARNLAITQGDRTVYAVKRLIGRRFDSPEADQIRNRVGYDMGPADDGGCLVSMAGDWYTPTEVSALILQVAKNIAERALDEEVDEAVITVPAYFNHQQRAATLEAARMAGLRCDRLLNEPTAAALAYGHRKDIERTIAVYDLGGGTFDVSVLHLSRGVYEVLSTAGETYLGGEDFDYRLVDYLADHFQTDHGVDLRQDRSALQRLKEAAERAKCELSFTDRTTVLVPRITPTESLEVAVSRLTLEGLVEDLVDRTLEIARGAVQDAGLKLSDIDDVILVGGQTRMPRVREAISALFQVEPSRSVHPEEVVAIGAAVHASSLTEADGTQPLLLDVTPFDLGIDVAGGLFQSIIKKNSHVPAAGTRVFATAHDNQDQVEVTVRQGDSRFAQENEFLGRFVMGGLTPAPRMQTKVEVTFRLDSNGMLHVSSVEQGTGERKQITIQNYAEVAQGDAEARVDGDVEAGPPTGADAPVATDDKPGFFGRLFGRGKKKDKKKAAKPAPAPQPAPAPVAPAPAAAPPAAALRAAEDEEAPVPLDPVSLQPADMEPMDLGADAFQALPDEDSPAAGGAVPLDMPEDEDFEADDGFETYDSSQDLGGKDTGGDLGFALADDLAGDDPFGGGSADPFGDGGDDPFSSGSDPFASGSDPFASADDPFAAPPDDDEEEDDGDDDTDDESTAFAMPLDEEADYATEESWDHSLHAPAPAPRPAPAPAPSPAPAPRSGLMPIEDSQPDPGATTPFRRPAPKGPRRRKPARLKLAYKEARSMVAEYRENLRKGGCFVKTPRPLPVGRECRIEVRAPGLSEPLTIPGVVTWSSADQTSLPPGHSQGMGIEYRLDSDGRRAVEDALARLAR